MHNTDNDNGTTLELYQQNSSQASTSKSLPEMEENTDSEEDVKKDFSKDWQRVAEVFDRLFFWLFLMAILISTLVLFHPLTDSYLKRMKDHHWWLCEFYQFSLSIRFLFMPVVIKKWPIIGNHLIYTFFHA